MLLDVTYFLKDVWDCLSSPLSRYDKTDVHFLMRSKDLRRDLRIGCMAQSVLSCQEKTGA